MASISQSSWGGKEGNLSVILVGNRKQVIKVFVCFISTSLNVHICVCVWFAFTQTANTHFAHILHSNSEIFKDIYHSGSTEKTLDH